jgi:hypothetical protein
MAKWNCFKRKRGIMDCLKKEAKWEYDVLEAWNNHVRLPN